MGQSSSEALTSYPSRIPHPSLTGVVNTYALVYACCMRTVPITEYPLDERDTTHDFSRFDWNTVHPLLSAEELDERDLSWMRVITPMEKAWQRVEEAIASPTAKQDADRHMAIFERDLLILGPSQQESFGQYDALLAAANLEAFGHRIRGERPAKTTITQQYYDNGAQSIYYATRLQERYRELSSEASRQNDPGIASLRGALAKSLVVTLLAKAGVSAVPASEREQHSAWDEYNHNVIIDREGTGQYTPLSVGNRNRRGRVHTDIYHFNATSALPADARIIIKDSIKGHAQKRLQQRLQVSSTARALEAVTWTIAPDIDDKSGEWTCEAKLARALGECILYRMDDYPAFVKPDAL